MATKQELEEHIESLENQLTRVRNIVKEEEPDDEEEDDEEEEDDDDDD
jgi:hypothetical protein